jgi:hypothetical protein
MLGHDNLRYVRLELVRSGYCSLCHLGHVMTGLLDLCHVISC